MRPTLLIRRAFSVAISKAAPSAGTVKIQKQATTSRNMFASENKNELLFPDKERFLRIIENMKLDGGTSNVTIMSDFDFTLTRDKVDGDYAHATFTLLEKSEFVSDNYENGARELFKKYRPIELDVNMDLVTKYNHMNSWWSQQYDLIVQEKLNKAVIRQMVEESRLYLRYQTKELFEFCCDMEIYLHIVSAGIADIIDQAVGLAFDHDKDYWRKICQYVQILGNRAIYSDDGYIIGFPENVIHSMNKSKFVNRNIYPHMKDNIIMMGDIIEDCTMVNETKYNNLLKIGFLNNMQKNGHLLEAYKKHYNVIVLNDGDLQVLLETLYYMTGVEDKSLKLIN